MTKRRPLQRVRIKRSKPADDVGYGKPPAQHRFKPGQSGNPRGRPKGAKNESTILHELLNRKVTLTDRGRPRKVTILEAMFMRFAEDSLKGSTKSAAFLLNRYGSMVSGEIERDALNTDERDILESYAQRLWDQFASKGARS